MKPINKNNAKEDALYSIISITYKGFTTKQKKRLWKQWVKRARVWHTPDESGLVVYSIKESYQMATLGMVALYQDLLKLAAFQKSVDKGEIDMEAIVGRIKKA